MTITRLVSATILSALILGCGKNNPSTPTPTTTTTTVPQQPTLYTITGTVTGAGAGPLGNASVRVDGGASAGMVANTDGAGRYTLNGLRFEGFTITASAPGYLPSSRGSMLTSGVTTATANFTLLPEAIFSRSGTGDTVFDIPSHVTRVRIQATYPGFCQNFAVQIAGRLVVNVILGTCSVADARIFDGTYLITGGGTVQITIATGVNWTVSEVR